MTENKDLIIKLNGEIMKLDIQRVATKVGSGSHVILPKGCEGKLFSIKLIREVGE